MKGRVYIGAVIEDGWSLMKVFSFFKCSTVSSVFLHGLTSVLTGSCLQLPYCGGC